MDYEHYCNTIYKLNKNVPNGVIKEILNYTTVSDNDEDKAKSYYLLGLIYNNKTNFNLSLNYFSESFRYGCLDAAYELSKLYRLQGNNEKCYEYIKKSKKLFGEENSVILNKNLKYLFDNELSICSFYLEGKKIEGFNAIENLIINDLPSNIQHIKNNAYSNYKFYVNKLDVIDHLKFNLDMNEISGNLQGERWKPLNPTIIHYQDEKYIMMIRSVNYTQDNSIYRIYNDKNIIISECHLYALTINKSNKNKNLISILGQIQISNNYNRIKNPTHIGIEDPRLFKKEQELWFSCTTPDTNPYRIPQISICNMGDIDKLWNIMLNPGLKILKIKIKSLMGPDIKRVEKNWLPYYNGNEINMIYSMNPLKILKPELDNKDIAGYLCNTVKDVKLIYDFKKFHGSAGPIPYKNKKTKGFLTIFHEIDPSRNYFHRFVFFDKNMNPLKVSKPFNFNIKGIEFCAGMTLNSNSKELIFTYGALDREVHISSISVENVNKILNNSFSLKKNFNDINKEVDKINTETTIVSFYLDLSKYEHRRKTSQHYLENCKGFLKLPYPMVLFLDEAFYETALNIRKEHGLEKYTKIIKLEFTDLQKNSYLEKLESSYNQKFESCQGRGIASYNKDKDTPKYMILNNSKYDIIKEAIKLNPFSSQEFSWIDFGILGCIKDFEGLKTTLSLKNEKICIPYIIPKTVHKDYDKFFGSNWYYVCAGFMSGSIEAWNKFFPHFDNLFETVINQGYYGNEEAFLGHLLVEKTELFEPYYSDYYGIFRNRNYLKTDISVAIRSFYETFNSELYQFTKITGESLIKSVEIGLIDVNKKIIEDVKNKLEIIYNLETFK